MDIELVPLDTAGIEVYKKKWEKAGEVEWGGERKGNRGRKEVRRKRRKGDGGGKGERSGGIVEGHNVLFMDFLFHTLHHISSDS